MYKVLIAEDGAPITDAFSLCEYESDYVPLFDSPAEAREFAGRRLSEENRDYGYTSPAITWQNNMYGWVRVTALPESYAAVVPEEDRHHEMLVTYRIVPV